jgi:hypothetical protein
MKFPFLLQAKFSSPVWAPYTSRISDSLKKKTRVPNTLRVNVPDWIYYNYQQILKTVKERPGNDGDRDVLAYMITIALRYKYQPLI